MLYPLYLTHNCPDFFVIVQTPHPIKSDFVNLNFFVRRYSSLAEGKMSLVTPFNQKMYSAGLKRQIQFALPLKIAGDVDFENTKLRWRAEPLQPADQTKLFEFSTIPYTSSNSILRLPNSPSQARIINVRSSKKVGYKLLLVINKITLIMINTNSLGSGTFLKLK